MHLAHDNVVKRRQSSSTYCCTVPYRLHPQAPLLLFLHTELAVPVPAGVCPLGAGRHEQGEDQRGGGEGQQLQRPAAEAGRRRGHGGGGRKGKNLAGEKENMNASPMENSDRNMTFYGPKFKSFLHL